MFGIAVFFEEKIEKNYYEKNRNIRYRSHIVVPYIIHCGKEDRHFPDGHNNRYARGDED